MITKDCYTYTLLYFETPGNQIEPPFDYSITALEDNGDGFDQRLKIKFTADAANIQKLLNLVDTGSKDFKVKATSVISA